MKTWMIRSGVAPMVLASVALVASAVPASAQDAGAPDARLRKLEAEVKALQRQVFPGGDPKFFPGAQQQQATSMTAPAGTPATTPITDLLTRLDAIEAQNTRLTAQVEELGNRVRQLEAGRGTAEGGVPAAGAPVAAPAPTVLEPAPRPAVSQPAPRPVVAAPRPVEARPVEARPVAAPPSRVAAVKAIVKPQTSDAAEDEYSYGFKLWEAKFYPEAAQQLKLYLDKYPNHRSASRARNLLGRAYLDDGKPREAAPWFLQNYQANKKGERAADSLLYLADAMIQLKDTNRACIALGEFADGYPTEAAGRLHTAYQGIAAKVQCN